jgi:hypothetical protein
MAASPRPEASGTVLAAVRTTVRMRSLIGWCHSLSGLVVLTPKELRPSLGAFLASQVSLQCSLRHGHEGATDYVIA